MSTQLLGYMVQEILFFLESDSKCQDSHLKTRSPVLEIASPETGFRIELRNKANLRAGIGTEINGTGNLWFRHYLFEIDNP